MYRPPTFNVVDSQVVELAARVAEECLWPRAASYDESGSYPVESWADLWQHGLLAAAAPEAYGGLGLDMPTYTAVIERLAYGCTNTAMTVHMHSVVMRFIEALATPGQKERFYAEVVDEGKLFASWGSEPGKRGGSRAARGTIVAPVDDGYVINGVKHFCSMAGVAHRNMVHWRNGRQRGRSWVPDGPCAEWCAGHGDQRRMERAGDEGDRKPDG